MYNDFVLIGPKADPAQDRWQQGHCRGAEEEWQSTQERRSCRAATRAARIWPSSICGRLSGIDIDKAKGPWYRDTGQGMGPALNTARIDERLSSWPIAAPGSRSRIAAISRSWSKATSGLFNQYGVMLVNPDKHPSVKKDLGQTFVDWVISPEGQKAIAEYKISGEQLFFPNAGQPGA